MGVVNWLRTFHVSCFPYGKEIGSTPARWRQISAACSLLGKHRRDDVRQRIQLLTQTLKIVIGQSASQP